MASDRLLAIAYCQSGTNTWQAIGGGGVTGSNTSNGWVKLSNGLIIQWGFMSTGSRGGVVTYPIPFPNLCLSALATYTSSYSSGSASVTPIILWKTNTQLSVGYKDVFSAIVHGFNWQAIGY